MKQRVWRNHGEALAEGDPPGTSPHDSIYSPLTCNVPPQMPHLAMSPLPCRTLPHWRWPHWFPPWLGPPYVCSSQANRGSTTHINMPCQCSTLLLCYDKVPGQLGHIRIHLPLPFSSSGYHLTTSLQHHPLAGFLLYTQNLTRGWWHLLP